MSSSLFSLSQNGSLLKPPHGSTAWTITMAIRFTSRRIDDRHPYGCDASSCANLLCLTEHQLRNRVVARTVK